ncbi:MAG: hypothetical protein QXS85_02015 [Acidilobaceae archaeon]
MGGRRKRRKIKRQKQVARVLRTRYFTCPSCNEYTLTIDIARSKDGSRLAVVKCGTCGLYCELPVSEIEETVDVYNKLSDWAYEGRLEEACSVKAPQMAEEEAEEALAEGEELEESAWEPSREEE